jgi:hypothetical protein
VSAAVGTAGRRDARSFAHLSRTNTSFGVSTQCPAMGLPLVSRRMSFDIFCKDFNAQLP